jgi:hypothetical protein
MVLEPQEAETERNSCDTDERGQARSASRQTFGTANVDDDQSLTAVNIYAVEVL